MIPRGCITLRINTSLCHTLQITSLRFAMFSCSKCCTPATLNVLPKESFYIAKDLIFTVPFGVMDLSRLTFTFCRHMWAFKAVKMFSITLYILALKFEVLI